MRLLQLEASPPNYVHYSKPLWRCLVNWAFIEFYSVCGEGQWLQYAFQG